MKKFILGFMLGGVLFGGISAIASVSAGCYGTGYATGWSVVNEDGDEMCDDPSITASLKEIQCD